MLKSCTKKYTDESDEHVFRFTFYCDCCGKPMPTRAIEFTQADISQNTPAEKRLWEMLWQKEHDAAHQRADSQAQNSLFRCPCCFEYVCEDCIRSVTTKEGSISPRCKRCYGKMPLPRPFKFIKAKTN